MEHVVENLQKIKQQIPSNVKIVAVSKTKPIEMIETLYNSGHLIFGENKVQEMVAKYEQLPKDIEWHMIGHLQTNKVKYIVRFVSLIHSVDSLKLLSEINKRAQQQERVIDCLIQIHIAQENTKFGMTYDEAEQFFSSKQWENYPNVNIRGLMGMATNTQDRQQVRREFAGLRRFMEKIQTLYMNEKSDFNELSMGMSHDYHIAVEEGSTMVRIGSLIFGPRNY